MMTSSATRRSKLSALSLLALPFAALLFVACEDDEGGLPEGNGGESGAGTGGRGGSSGNPRGGSKSTGGDGGATESEGGSAPNGEGGSAGSMVGEGGNPAAGASGSPAGGDGFGGAAAYEGPSVGRANTFAALAYSAVTSANISVIGGELGVSAAALSTITGFTSPLYKKYGMDSLAPNDQRTMLAQQDVTALVGDINPRPCDADLTNVVGGLTGDITLHPGVTCMNSPSADVLLNGHVYLDAGGDPNAYFIIRGNMTLTVADGAEVVLKNGAQACGVFWRISNEITIGKTAILYGTFIAGSAITMKTGSVLNGRALAQTAGVHLDANTVKIPTACTHIQ